MPIYNFDDINENNINDNNKFNKNKFNINFNNILLKILYILTYIQNIFIDFYNIFNEFHINFYINHFDKQILNVNYINNNRINKNIYNIYLDPIYYLKCLFKYKIYKYNLNSLIEIINLVHNKKEGLLLIEYFNNKYEKILINLELFRNDNEVLSINDISSILENFILYKVKNKIVHVEIEDNNITEKFLEFKNSYKLDNIKLTDIIYVINILYNTNYNEKGLTKITDDEVNENTYEYNKYINL